MVKNEKRKLFAVSLGRSLNYLFQLVVSATPFVNSTGSVRVTSCFILDTWKKNIIVRSAPTQLPMRRQNRRNVYVVVHGVPT